MLGLFLYRLFPSSNLLHSLDKLFRKRLNLERLAKDKLTFSRNSNTEKNFYSKLLSPFSNFYHPRVLQWPIRYVIQHDKMFYQFHAFYMRGCFDESKLIIPLRIHFIISILWSKVDVFIIEKHKIEIQINNSRNHMNEPKVEVC